jgi:hypothetical protein
MTTANEIPPKPLCCDRCGNPNGPFANVRRHGVPALEVWCKACIPPELWPPPESPTFTARLIW